MRIFLIPILIIFLFANSAFADGKKAGDKVIDFKLKNVDGKMVSMADFTEAKGFVIIFTSNHCNTSKDYEELIIKLDKKYKELGFPFIAINPSDPSVYETETHAHMVTRAKNKAFTFPYLQDANQNVARSFGATRTPEAFLIEKVGEEYFVRYMGTIDLNTEFKDKKSKYLSNAIDALLEGNEPDPSYKKPGGCEIVYTED